MTPEWPLFPVLYYRSRSEPEHWDPPKPAVPFQWPYPLTPEALYRHPVDVRERSNVSRILDRAQFDRERARHNAWIADHLRSS